MSYDRTYFHYSESKLCTLDRYPRTGDTIHKPAGLWLSDDFGNFSWPWRVTTSVSNRILDWTTRDLGLLNYRAPFRINPSKKHNVLLISTPEELECFASNCYGIQVHNACIDRLGRTRGCALHIDWTLVKNRYLGILITPFQEQLSRSNTKIWLV